jgi:hypothetical protein
VARRYYDTTEKIYSLLKTHPATSSMITEFEIADAKVMDVANYLLLNNDEIQEMPLAMYYSDSDMLDQIAELYGYSVKPWASYATPAGSTLLELLHTTIYLYKFGVTDNFYEKNFLNFLPEYDRDQILATPKLKLTVESLGRKLDQMEDAITRIADLYDIDKCPDEFLDYLGQNIGYEREDFTLSSVSFRELLKNIIEIYKIKGTNYSFSFFFKFLGFEINLKEFYFNRDVKNPEAFPGMTELNVEYYLTTTNPIKETGKPSIGINLKPAPYLAQTRNLDDWRIELNSLKDHGCTNPDAYMRGAETYNGDGLTWHKNPWTYFKTNLIEYQLEPFINRMNLTASDNETIKKYVKFLSPTYLFTWINVNLRPWIEDINVLVDENDAWMRHVVKVLGDPRPTPTPWPMLPQGLPGVPVHVEGEPWEIKTAQDEGFQAPYNDYEDLMDILIFKTGGEDLIRSIIKTLNLDQADQWGTVLRRDGEHARQPGNPKHIANAYHRSDKRLCFDSLSLMIKGQSQSEYEDYSSKPFPAVPVDIHPFIGQTIADINIVEMRWEQIFNSSEYWLQISLDNRFENTDEWKSTNLLADIMTTSNDYIHPQNLNNDIYYWRIRSRNALLDYYQEDQEPDWTRYTYTPESGYIPESYVHNTGWGPWSNTYYFNVKTIPFPFDNETINRKTKYVSPLYQWNTAHTVQIFVYATFTMVWNIQLRTEFYEVEFTSESGSVSIAKVFNNTLTRNFSNGTYRWRYRAKSLEGIYGEWSEQMTFTVSFQEII